MNTKEILQCSQLKPAYKRRQRQQDNSYRMAKILKIDIKILLHCIKRAHSLKPVGGGGGGGEENESQDSKH